jgi:hypothetical protein
VARKELHALRPRRLRAVGAACPIDGVDPERSLDLLVRRACDPRALDEIEKILSR